MAQPGGGAGGSGSGAHPTGGDGRPVLAVDIGGTKMAVSLVSPTGALLGVRRVPTARGPGADAETLWAALARVIDDVLVAAGRPEVAGVGAGCGGPMSWPAGEVSPVNILGWRGFPLRARLSELPVSRSGGGVPVRLHNDAVCVTAAEHWLGAAAGHRDALGMVVSTGVGGGLVLGGRLVDGATGNAGHIGHIVVDPDGPPCPCGNRGCLEVVSSGTAVAAWAATRGWVPRTKPADQESPARNANRPPSSGLASPASVVAAAASPPRAVGDPPVSARDLATAALAGDELARAAFERAGRSLGFGIANAVTLIDVSVVTIGGGLSQVGDLLFGPLHASYARWARLPHARAARVVPAALGPEAGLIGAAALVLGGDRYWSAD